MARWWVSQCAMLLAACLLLGGCGSASDRTVGQPGDLDADALYSWGTSRDDLERRYGAGTFVWVADTIPKDEFAAATMKEIVSLRKQRPVAYEMFRRRDPQGGAEAYVRDYVFFNDQFRVMYAARRRPQGGGR
jgi:hypothetical protein